MIKYDNIESNYSQWLRQWVDNIKCNVNDLNKFNLSIKSLWELIAFQTRINKICSNHKNNQRNEWICNHCHCKNLMKKNWNYCYNCKYGLNPFYFACVTKSINFEINKLFGICKIDKNQVELNCLYDNSLTFTLGAIHNCVAV